MEKNGKLSLNYYHISTFFVFWLPESAFMSIMIIGNNFVDLTCRMVHIWASSWEGCHDWLRLEPSFSATEAGKSLWILGWSASLSFTYNINEPALEILVFITYMASDGSGECTSVQSLQSLGCAHMKYGSIQRVWPKIRQLVPLDGCACASKEWDYRGWKVP